MKITSPYSNASFISRIKTSLEKNGVIRLAFMDVDSTLVGDVAGDKNKIIHEVRTRLTDEGYIFILVTTRPEEMLMCKHEYELSWEKYQFRRPPPKLGRHGNDHFVIDPVKAEPEDLLNADILAASMGTRIYVHQQGGGYQRVDFMYNKDLDVILWQTEIREIINKININSPVAKIAPYCIKENYINGDTDVYPPDIYVKVTVTNLKNKHLFLSLFNQLKVQSKYKLVQKTNAIDNTNLEKERYSLFLTPHTGKNDAVGKIINDLSKEFNITREHFEVFSAGDSWADLEMGFYGGKKIKRWTFMVAGGSRLSSFLTKKNIHDFAGEDLKPFKEYLRKKNGKPGVYVFNKKFYERTIIIGDLAYPGTKYSESILAYLKS